MDGVEKMKDQTVGYLMFAAFCLNLLIPSPYCWITLAVVVLIGIVLLLLTVRNRDKSKV